MRFRLVWGGELKPTQRDPRGGQPDKLSEHKQSLRRSFHRQLKELWSTNTFLRTYQVVQGRPDDAQQPITSLSRDMGVIGEIYLTLAESIAKETDNQAYGFRYVPLVRKRYSLLCSLEILFLRRDIPGSVIQAGDLDNRIKTLIDALRRPRSQNEVPAGDRPAPDEDPFFCLLEDDDVVTALAVETDTLLDAAANARQTSLVITVKLSPYDPTLFNLSLGV
jgi:hypothetical protein